MRILRNCFRFAAIPAGLLLVIWSWAAYLENAALQRSNVQLRQSRVYPMPISGLKLDLLKETQVLDSGETPSAGSAFKGALLMVSNGSCPVSAANLPPWRRLISSIEWEEGMELWLLTLRNGAHMQPFARRLKADGRIPFKYLRPKRRSTFGPRTGLSAVPFTAVLDSSKTIRLVHYGALNQEHFAPIIGRLERFSQSSSDLVAAAE